MHKKKTSGRGAAACLQLAAQNDLILADVDAREPVHARDRELLPRDVADRAAILVDEVVVRIDLRIEDDATLSEDQLAEQPLRDEEVQRVVDGGARDHREAAL